MIAAALRGVLDITLTKLFNATSEVPDEVEDDDAKQRQALSTRFTPFSGTGERCLGTTVQNLQKPCGLVYSSRTMAKSEESQVGLSVLDGKIVCNSCNGEDATMHTQAALNFFTLRAGVGVRTLCLKADIIP